MLNIALSFKQLCYTFYMAHEAMSLEFLGKLIDYTYKNYICRYKHKAKFTK